MKFTTILLLLFTITVFSSCTKGATKSTDHKKSTEKSTQKTPSTTIKRVDATAFDAEITGKEVQLVDVRTPKEYVQGHIEKAININVYDPKFVENTNKLDKSKPVYVYCRSGARSMKAAGDLKKRGYNVVNLNGGIGGWMRGGFKLVK